MNGIEIKLIKRINFAVTVMATITIASILLAACPSDGVDPQSQVTYISITFNGNGATFSGGAQTTVKQVVKNSLYSESPPSITQTGYGFVGWSTQASGGTMFNFTTTKITSELTLYAQWGELVNVTFNGNGATFSGGAQTTAKQVVKNSLYSESPPSITRTGFSLAGWSTQVSGGTMFDFTTTQITSELTLYAQWGESVNITFYGNGARFGTEPDSPITQEVPTVKGYLFTGTLPEITRTDYGFNGWFTQASGGMRFDFTTTQITSELALYAQWVKDYEVIFDGNGAQFGINVDSPTFESVNTPVDRVMSNNVIPSNLGQRTGYYFLGWSTEKTGGDLFDLTTTEITGPITLYAKWTDDFDWDPGDIEIIMDKTKLISARKTVLIPVTVKYLGKVMTYNRDYSLSIENNPTEFTFGINGISVTANTSMSGTSYTLVISGAGAFDKNPKQTESTTFTINVEQLSINDNDITTLIQEKTLIAANEDTLSVTISLSGDTMTHGTDYTLEITNRPNNNQAVTIGQDGNIAIGGGIAVDDEGEYTYTITGVGEFVGTRTGTFLIKVLPSNINIETEQFIIELPVPEQVPALRTTSYSVTIKNSTATLKNWDYTISITDRPNNVNVNRVKFNEKGDELVLTEDIDTSEDGEYTVEVTGVSPYEGTLTGTFNITTGKISSLTYNHTIYEEELNVAITDGDYAPTLEPNEATAEYSIDPATLPKGLTFNSATGTITGTPEEVYVSTSYEITATGTGAWGDEATFSINIEVANKRGEDYLVLHLDASSMTDSSNQAGYDGQTGITGFNNLSLVDYEYDTTKKVLVFDNVVGNPSQIEFPRVQNATVAIVYKFTNIDSNTNWLFTDSNDYPFYPSEELTGKLLFSSPFSRLLNAHYDGTAVTNATTINRDTNWHIIVVDVYNNKWIKRIGGPDRNDTTKGLKAQVAEVKIWKPGANITKADVYTELREKWITSIDTVMAEAKLSLEPRFANGDSSDQVKSNITLPDTGKWETTIRWASSDENVIATDGSVVRPEIEDKQVTLTATIEKTGAVSLQKEFILTVKALVVLHLAADTLDNITALNSQHGVTGSNSVTLATYEHDSTKNVLEFNGTDSVVNFNELTNPMVAIVFKFTTDSIADRWLFTHNEDSAFTPSETTMFSLTNSSLNNMYFDKRLINQATSLPRLNKGWHIMIANVTGRISRIGGIDRQNTDNGLKAQIAEVIVWEAYRFDDTQKAEKYTELYNKWFSGDTTTIETAKNSVIITYSAGDDASNVTQDVIPGNPDIDHTTIGWTTNNSLFVSAQGTVTRSSVNKDIMLTATIYNKDNMATSEFALTVTGDGADPFDVSKVHVDTSTLTSAVDILDQKGVTGMFRMDYDGYIVANDFTEHINFERLTEPVVAIVFQLSDATSTNSVLFTDKSASPFATTGSNVFFDTSYTRVGTLIYDGTENPDLSTIAKDTNWHIMVAEITQGGAIQRMGGPRNTPVYGSTLYGLKGKVAEFAVWDKTTADIYLDETDVYNRLRSKWIGDTKSEDAQDVTDDASALAIVYASGDSASNVTANVTLPAIGSNGSTITWTSNHPSIISPDGKVSRSKTDITVHLKALIHKKLHNSSRDFDLTVIADTNIDPFSLAEFHIDASVLTSIDDINNQKGVYAVNSVDLVTGTEASGNYFSFDDVLDNISFKVISEPLVAIVFQLASTTSHQNWLFSDEIETTFHPAETSGGAKFFVKNGLDSNTMLDGESIDYTDMYKDTEWHVFIAKVGGNSFHKWTLISRIGGPDRGDHNAHSLSYERGFVGKIAEVVVWPDDLSNSIDRASISSTLMTKWNITDTNN